MIGLEALSDMEYPGRFIILGRSLDNEHNVAIYGITGRSAPSRARELKDNGNEVNVSPTDQEVLKKGNPELLIYPAMRLFPRRGIAVSNGKQTAELDLENLTLGDSPLTILETVHRNWEYEPDSPNFTPRISGVLTLDGAALGIIKKSGDKVVRNYFEVPLVPGRGYLISTYSGKNVNPLPSFSGEPIPVSLPWADHIDTAVRIYSALGPKKEEISGQSGDDLRVAVVAAYQDHVSGTINHYIMNRVSLGETK